MSLHKAFLSALLGMAVMMPAHAINVKKDMRSAWGYTKRDNCPAENAPDFIIAGTLGKTGQHGTHSDEWGIVAMIAKKIVAHGGYFCPYQLQCANQRKNKKSWTMYYRPNGYTDGKCVWLCEPGYAGENCAAASGDASCDHTSYTTTSGGKFSGLSLKTTGGSAGQVESEVAGFDAWYQKKKYCGADFGSKKNEIDVLLGVTKFLEHGVMIGPVRVQCQRVNWKDNDSYVETVKKETGRHVLACASGYEPNSQYTDCVPTSKCAPTVAEAVTDPTAGVTFCDGFPEGSFNPATHYLKNVGSCSKFFCTQPGQAYPSAGAFECIECATGIKGGPHPTNGQCVVCQTGQFFNADSGECQAAAAYSKTDMVYGKGQTRNTVPNVLDQCWPKVTPDEYKVCVIHGVTDTEDMGDADSETTSSGTGFSLDILPAVKRDLLPGTGLLNAGPLPSLGSVSSGTSGSSLPGGSGGSSGGSGTAGVVVDTSPAVPTLPSNGFSKIQTQVQFQQAVRTPVKRQTVK